MFGSARIISFPSAQSPWNGRSLLRHGLGGASFYRGTGGPGMATQMDTLPSPSPPPRAAEHSCRGPRPAHDLCNFSQALQK